MELMEENSARVARDEQPIKFQEKHHLHRRAWYMLTQHVQMNSQLIFNFCVTYIQLSCVLVCSVKINLSI